MKFIENLVHAPDGVVASILYLFICFVTVIWLLVVYFNKKRKNSYRAVYFKIILFTIITLLVSNAIVVFFINEGVTGIIFRIAYALHWECFNMVKKNGLRKMDLKNFILVYLFQEESYGMILLNIFQC